jgi:hypothetical protein
MRVVERFTRQGNEILYEVYELEDIATQIRH